MQVSSLLPRHVAVSRWKETTLLTFTRLVVDWPSHSPAESEVNFNDASFRYVTKTRTQATLGPHPLHTMDFGAASFSAMLPDSKGNSLSPYGNSKIMSFPRTLSRLFGGDFHQESGISNIQCGSSFFRRHVLETVSFTSSASPDAI